MIDHSVKVYGISFIKSIINMALLFKTVDCSFIIEYFFIIFIAAGYFIMTADAIENGVILPGILIAFAVFFFIFPFKIPSGIYLSFDALFMWILPNITSKKKVINMNIEDENDIKNDILLMHSEGYKQTEIARKVGMTQGYISRVINKEKK